MRDLGHGKPRELGPGSHSLPGPLRGAGSVQLSARYIFTVDVVHTCPECGNQETEWATAEPNLRVCRAPRGCDFCWVVHADGRAAKPKESQPPLAVDDEVDDAVDDAVDDEVVELETCTSGAAQQA